MSLLGALVTSIFLYVCETINAEMIKRINAFEACGSCRWFTTNNNVQELIERYIYIGWAGGWADGRASGRAGRQGVPPKHIYCMPTLLTGRTIRYIMCGHPIAKIIMTRFKHQDKRQHCLKAIMYILYIGNLCLYIDGVKRC